jgi:hypothetical protein
MFAYSMFYPYTDNVMDDVSQGTSEKAAMNESLRHWLEGNNWTVQNAHEDKLLQLVQLIEQDFDRQRFPGVFQSILCIFNAQIKSLGQQQPHATTKTPDILDVSFEKGGTSVLADGYLINGEIDEAQEDFCYGYGVFLQLADDVQDVVEDQKNHHITLFSRSVGHHVLDKLTNKLFNFMHQVIDMHLLNPANSELRELILKNCNLLILEAIGRNQQFFSREYVRKIEHFFPVHFHQFNAIRQKFSTSYQVHKAMYDFKSVYSKIRFINFFRNEALNETK